MGAPLPGATTAFKPKAAPTAGVKPQQVGNVKFPGKVNTKISHLLPPVSEMGGGMKVSGASNVMIGSALAALAGRLAMMIPGVSAFLAANPTARDATIGAAVAIAVDKLNEPDEPNDGAMYMPRPSDPAQHGWKLQ
jgi:hypothetical protein